jgi:sugar lactone lactonase YvrE
MVALAGGSPGCNCGAAGSDAANGNDAGSDSGTGSDGGLPTNAPSKVTAVASTGFHAPTDAVASPDGTTFYFAAYTEDADPEPAIFSVPAAGGKPTVRVQGVPLGHPTGLVLSCDGDTLYVADMESAVASMGADGGDVFALTLATDTIGIAGVTGIETPAGLAMGPDCATLFVTGWDDTGVPSVFTAPDGGGKASVLYGGAPLASPTGLHVDAAETAWVLDHLAVGANGEGVLFSIAMDGTLAEVASGLHLGDPGGVSLVAGGGTLVIAGRDAAGVGELVAVDIATGATVTVDASALVDPSGLRTARGAGVFAVVDSEGGAIFRAE